MCSVDGGVLVLIMLATVLITGCMAAMQRGRSVVDGKARAGVCDRAARAERRRVAGEIHDVVAQSFNDVLLRLSEARRVLQQGGDIDEAVSALVDAERLGRLAMADIRRAIRRLDSGQTRTTAGPDIEDIDDGTICSPSTLRALVVSTDSAAGYLSDPSPAT